jgi:fructose-specific phosphotransferase system component IIB
MAKPRIFLSSTFYDLKQVRADIDMFIESLGYEPVRNEEGDIPYGKDDALEEYCYKEIKTIDILISIIGGRFGSESRRNSASVSQIELKTALKEGKQIYIFIDKNVLAEYETYLLNKENETKFRYVDDSRVYKFIEEIKGLNANNNIKGFETANDITKYLREQFAGLFQRFLEEQTRIKEISIISNLEKTAQTLNKLVNYLSDENKDQAEEINRILTINHTLVEKFPIISISKVIMT